MVPSELGVTFSAGSSEWWCQGTPRPCRSILQPAPVLGPPGSPRCLSPGAISLPSRWVPGVLWGSPSCTVPPALLPSANL